MISAVNKFACIVIKVKGVSRWVCKNLQLESPLGGFVTHVLNEMRSCFLTLPSFHPMQPVAMLIQIKTSDVGSSLAR